jgi:hypothetical protein
MSLFIFESNQKLLKGLWFVSWQEKFEYFIGSMYRYRYEKENREIQFVTSISRFPVYTRPIHMCIVPGPASQDAVLNAYTFRRVYSVMKFNLDANLVCFQ